MMLSMNISTAKGSLEKLKSSQPERVKGFQTNLNTLRKHLNRGHPLLVSVGKISKKREDQEIDLPRFARWLLESNVFSGIEVPQQLLSRSASAEPSDTQPSSAVEKSERVVPDRITRGAETRQTNTLLKICLGLAMAAYDYKVEGAGRDNSVAIDLMAGDLKKVGLAVSANTIREKLAEAEDERRKRDW